MEEPPKIKNSLGDEFRILQGMALNDIRKNGKPGYATDPENAFDIGLGRADMALEEGMQNWNLAVSYLTETGMSLNVASVLLSKWVAMHREHPEGRNIVN